MTGLERALEIIVKSIAIGFAGFLGTCALVVVTDPCDTTKHVCDIAPIAGFGLGVVVGTALTLVSCGILAWRARRRPLHTAGASAE